MCLAKRYTTDHEWVSFDSDSAVGTMGITEYAQKSLGDVVFVELPAANSTIAQGGEFKRQVLRRRTKPETGNDVAYMGRPRRGLDSPQIQPIHVG